MSFIEVMPFTIFKKGHTNIRSIAVLPDKEGLLVYCCIGTIIVSYFITVLYIVVQ